MTATEYKSLRQRIGRQKEVAVALGISRSHLAHREAGSVPITTEASLALEALAMHRGYAEALRGVATKSPVRSSPTKHEGESYEVVRVHRGRRPA